jgi:hypothetical protein
MSSCHFLLGWRGTYNALLLPTTEGCSVTSDLGEVPCRKSLHIAVQ